MKALSLKSWFVAGVLALVWSACVTTPGQSSSITVSVPSPTGAEPSPQASGTTYYVRPDGGSAAQCTGLVNAPYPGSGSARACAWDHPFHALPPDGTPRMVGGDTLMIAAGSYRMGYGAPGADSCEADGAYDCHMTPIPSGPHPDAPTRVLGQGWDRGCVHPPELWGAERPWQIVSLEGSNNVELACLEITDHSSCVEDHVHGLGGSPFTCVRDTYPYGDWADTGLYAVDSANVYLHDLNIHGLAVAGIRGGRLRDWMLEDVRIAGNGWVGWEGDVEGEDANSGTLTFRRWTVEWNGCAETWPGGEPTACWAQPAGGYGDGVGTGATGGDWIIEDSAILHNTSDGLDLLYHSLGGRIVLNRVRAEGNAGNQVKVSGQAQVTNSLLVGNCSYFRDQPSSFSVDAIDHCRAGGNTIEFHFTGGEHSTIIHSTIYGHGDGLIASGPREGYACDGTENLQARNNVLLGDSDYFDPSDITFLFYQEQCGDLRLDSDYNILYRTKNVECGVDGEHVQSGDDDLCQDPRLTGPFRGSAYGLRLTQDSPAIDAAASAFCPTTDILGSIRPLDGDADGVARCDMGAYEYLDWRPTTWIYLPAAFRSSW